MIYFLIIFLFFGNFQLEAVKEKSICLNMIVKDEIDVIERCLKSVLPFIDYWVIVDTGSSDNTQEKIINFMKEHGVDGELHERPWINFSHNRNEALNLAKAKSDYIFFIDADEYLVYENDFNLPSLHNDFYYLRVSHSGSTYCKQQLVKSKLNWKWNGVLHEYLSCPEAHTSSILEGVKTIYTTEGARSKNPLKYHKDAQVLEEALKDDPLNSRYVFYLAQSYRDAFLYENALQTYIRRVSMKGWEQEVYYSLLQIALMKEHLNFPKNEIMNSYFEAFSYRPQRAEPLFYLARYLRTLEEFETGYKIAVVASDIPRPSDILFLEDWIYQYGIDLERSVNAYWIGNYEESKNLSLELLSSGFLPRNVRDIVEKNLQFANLKLVENSIRDVRSSISFQED